MSTSNLTQYMVFVAIVAALVRPLGGYMARVFAGEKTALDPLLHPLETFIYRLTGVDPELEMDWLQYSLAFIVFGLVGALVLYAILRLQQFLPFFYAKYQTTPLNPDLAMNTGISFATTTTWQAYSGETTMSYASQIVGLTVQNFLAGASGLAVGVAFIRGFAREQTSKLGNFWVDMLRSVLWILLPLSLVWQHSSGLARGADELAPLCRGDHIGRRAQIIPQGPVAALESIKNLGTERRRIFQCERRSSLRKSNPVKQFY